MRGISASAGGTVRALAHDPCEAQCANLAASPSPVQGASTKWKNVKRPKVMGAGLILVLALGGLGGGLGALQPEALDILDLVPRATQKFDLMVRGKPRSAPGAIAKVRKAATKTEKAANTAGSPAAATASAPVKPGSETAVKIREYLVMGTVSVAAGFGQLIVVAALVYFLLIAGDTFRRTLARINGTP